jgi:hypothetical protein
MKLPELKEADKYTGLYVVDFEDHCGVGFVASEVAELLESAQFSDVQVYKVHRANPDGTMELKGVANQTFQLEAGIFFHAVDEETARADYDRLLAWADQQSAPSRCKVQLIAAGDSFVTAMIYPAEFDDAFSRWLLDGQYRTEGAVEAGTSVAGRHYDAGHTILANTQLWPVESADYLTGQALLEATKRAIVR